MPITVGSLRERLAAMLDEKQPRQRAMAGLLGRVSDEQVEVTTRPGYVYVRMGNAETLGQVRNKRVPNTYNLPVYVGVDPVSREVEILGIRQGAYIKAGYDAIPEIEPHASTHQWPSVGDSSANGSDAVHIHWRQIRGLRVTIVSGFTVKAGGAPLYREGTGWTWIPEQNLDLTDLKPTTGAKYALVYLDADGVLQYREGTRVFPSTDIDISDCPSPTTDEIPLAAVMLTGAQSQIRETRDAQDIVDLRFPQTTLAQSIVTVGQLAAVESELDYDITRLLMDALPKAVTALQAEVEAELDYALTRHVVEG